MQEISKHTLDQLFASVDSPRYNQLLFSLLTAPLNNETSQLAFIYTLSSYLTRYSLLLNQNNDAAKAEMDLIVKFLPRFPLLAVVIFYHFIPIFYGSSSTSLSDIEAFIKTHFQVILDLGQLDDCKLVTRETVNSIREIACRDDRWSNVIDWVFMNDIEYLASSGKIVKRGYEGHKHFSKGSGGWVRSCVIHSLFASVLPECCKMTSLEYWINDAITSREGSFIDQFVNESMDIESRLKGIFSLNSDLKSRRDTFIGEIGQFISKFVANAEFFIKSISIKTLQNVSESSLVFIEIIKQFSTCSDQDWVIYLVRATNARLNVWALNFTRCPLDYLAALDAFGHEASIKETIKLIDCTESFGQLEIKSKISAKQVDQIAKSNASVLMNIAQAFEEQGSKGDEEGECFDEFETLSALVFASPLVDSWRIDGDPFQKVLDQSANVDQLVEGWLLASSAYPISLFVKWIDRILFERKYNHAAPAACLILFKHQVLVKELTRVLSRHAPSLVKSMFKKCTSNEFCADILKECTYDVEFLSTLIECASEPALVEYFEWILQDSTRFPVISALGKTGLSHLDVFVIVYFKQGRSLTERAYSLDLLPLLQGYFTGNCKRVLIKLFDIDYTNAKQLDVFSKILEFCLSESNSIVWFLSWIPALCQVGLKLIQNTDHDCFAFILLLHICSTDLYKKLFIPTVDETNAAAEAVFALSRSQSNLFISAIRNYSTLSKDPNNILPLLKAFKFSDETDEMISNALVQLAPLNFRAFCQGYADHVISLKLSQQFSALSTSIMQLDPVTFCGVLESFILQGVTARPAPSPMKKQKTGRNASLSYAKEAFRIFKNLNSTAMYKILANSETFFVSVASLFVVLQESIRLDHSTPALILEFFNEFF